MLFSEQHFNHQNRKYGSIEVICGSMFSGKTEELIRRLKRAKIARLNVNIYKPKTDHRYDENAVVTHNQAQIDAIAVASSAEILSLTMQKEAVIGVDEAQFFDLELIEVCNSLANKGHRVIVAGLDMDYKGRPFGPMPGLLAIAEHITKVHAICVCCGAPASFSFRKSQIKETILLGETQDYEPRCRICYQMKSSC